jgi:5-methylcytosine-specific restriction endonuclease McrA
MRIKDINDDTYVFRKEVDWSALHKGISIPVTFQNVPNLSTKRGVDKDIRIIPDGVSYEAKLYNVDFNRVKYPNHKDMVQIRYNSNSALSQYLRNVFYSSFSLLSTAREKLDNKRNRIILPTESRVYIAIYNTSVPDTLLFECINSSDISLSQDFAKGYSEEEIERIVSAVDVANIIGIEKIMKMRKLDRSIGENLKKLYDYRCQICGIQIGTEYGVRISHIHHIEYFTRSLNNDAANIIIICPNHHSIIHAANPKYDKYRKMFLYPNGYADKISINLHL